MASLLHKQIFDRKQKGLARQLDSGQKIRLTTHHLKEKKVLKSPHVFFRIENYFELEKMRFENETYKLVIFRPI